MEKKTANCKKVQMYSTLCQALIGKNCDLYEKHESMLLTEKDLRKDLANKF